MRKPIVIFFTLFLVFGCGKKKCEIDPQIAKIPVDIKIDRLEKPFFAAKSEAAMLAFLNNNPAFTTQYLQSDQYPDEEQLVGSLLRLSNEPNLNKFASETNTRFGEMKDVEQELENAFRHLKFYYPQFTIPAVKTFVSGLLGQDLLVTDSLLVLGIDYFSGKEASYRPQQPGYILKRYAKPFMVPAVVTQISSAFNKTNLSNKTMLADMINFGKSYYFTQRMMPCNPDSTIIGYSDQEMADISYNEGKIWAHFIDKGLLYETNHFKVNKYTGERPNVPEISPRCPGRIATWVGWQIVRKYMQEHPEVTLPQLMLDTDAQKIFLQSKYKPKRK